MASGKLMDIFTFLSHHLLKKKKSVKQRKIVVSLMLKQTWDSAQ